MNTDILTVCRRDQRLLAEQHYRPQRPPREGRRDLGVIDGYESCAAMLRGYGVEITLAGGETADVGDLVRTVIADSTVFAGFHGLTWAIFRASSRAI